MNNMLIQMSAWNNPVQNTAFENKQDLTVAYSKHTSIKMNRHWILIQNKKMIGQDLQKVDYDQEQIQELRG